jgi:hypothetical protein
VGWGVEDFLSLLLKHPPCLPPQRSLRGPTRIEHQRRERGERYEEEILPPVEVESAATRMGSSAVESSSKTSLAPVTNLFGICSDN